MNYFDQFTKQQMVAQYAKCAAHLGEMANEKNDHYTKGELKSAAKGYKKMANKLQK